MKDTRLIKLIKRLSKEELKSFQKFLESPFLKPARNTITLFEYIAKFYPDYEEENLKKEVVFKKLFKGEEYNEKKLLNLIFDLTRAAEDFLAHYTMKDDEIEYLLNLSKGFVIRNLRDESNRVNKIIDKKLKPGFSPTMDYISKFRRLTYLKSIYYSEKNEFENLIDTKKNYFEASAIQFIVDFAQIMSDKKPALATYGNRMENVLIDSITQSFDIKKLLSLLDESEYEKKSLIKLHYLVLRLNESAENTEHYYNLRDFFYETLPDYNREERFLIFQILANYCVENSLGKKIDFRREGFEVHKKKVETNSFSFSENEYMDVITYRNIVQYCISLREADWLEIFLEKYSHMIQPELRVDMKNLSLGHLYFMRKEFEKALEAVCRINSEFFLFKTDLKNIMLRIYFELEYFEQAFSLVDSYKHFLANSKEILKSLRITYGNFVKFYFDLLKIKAMQSKESPDFVKKKIEKENNIVSKSWLIEKSEELMKNKSKF